MRRTSDDGWMYVFLDGPREDNSFKLTSTNPLERFGPRRDCVRLSIDTQGNWVMSAFCPHCGYTKQRTCKPGASGQGRPFAFLVAWLLSECQGFVAHGNLKPAFLFRRIMRFRLNEIEHDTRGTSPFDQFFGSERPPNSKVDDMAIGEPFSIP